LAGPGGGAGAVILHCVRSIVVDTKPVGRSWLSKHQNHSREECALNESPAQRALSARV